MSRRSRFVVSHPRARTSREDGARKSGLLFQQAPLGLGAVPDSCMGMACGGGSGDGVKPTRLFWHCWMVVEPGLAGEGSDGMDLSGLLKLNAVVISPTVDRRQADRL